MINQAQLVDRLKVRFRSSASEVRPGILRISEQFLDRVFAIRYFDFSGKLIEAASRLRDYQEDLMGETFFGEQSPTDLRWNHYLYFIADENQTTSHAFREAKASIESDRTYARKAVLTLKEFDSLFATLDAGPSSPPVDIASQWTTQLDTQGLAYLLDDEVSAPEAVRLISAGGTPTATQPAELPKMSEAEIAAGSNFLKSLNLTGFREYPSSKRFDFGIVNLIVGRNGTGKTSLLEAIEYLYCGANRRSASAPAGTIIDGNLFNDAALTASPSSIKTDMMRARNARWYAKADVRKSTLADSFGKFNFLDTDAAVDLSNKDDSEDRIKKDIARLIFGAEAEKLATKLTRVGEKVDEAVRSVERDRVDIQERLKEARARLDAIHKTPKISDTLYSGVLEALIKSRWKNLPDKKQEAAMLNDSIHSTIVAAQHLARATTGNNLTSLSSLTEQRAILNEKLRDATVLIKRIDVLVRDSASASQLEASIRSRQTLIDVLSRYANSGLSDYLEQLRVLQVRVDSAAAKLAAMDNALVHLGDMRESEVPLDKACLTAENNVREWGVVIRERTSRVQALAATMENVNVLRQQLLSTATDLLAQASDPDHCPVCKTKFETGQLKLRMSIKAEDDQGKALSSAQTSLVEASSKQAQAKQILAALNALASLAPIRDGLSVRLAYKDFTRSQETVEQERRELEGLARMIAQLGKDGLTEGELRKLVSELGLNRPPNKDDLESMRLECSNKIDEQAKLKKQTEKELSSCQVALTNITGVPAASVDARPDEQLKQLSRRIAELDVLVSAANTIESNVDSPVQGDVPLELRLEQVSGELSRLNTALQAEVHAASAAKSEENNIETLKNHLAAYEEQVERLRSANGLIQELLKQARSGVFVDQVISANAAAIGKIFAAIHAPDEFMVQMGDEGLTITRKLTKQNTSLREMSTGQRAAYALSLFFSMNRSLVSGPPLMLLDDPVTHVDDMNTLSFLDYLRDVAITRSRQIFLATADDKLAGLFRQKFRFMGEEQFREFTLSRS